jgi:hypothetical protein
MTFIPCSPRHKSCSPAHAELVESYRIERHRQEVELEAATGGYAGDIAFYKATNGWIVSFGDWLKAHKVVRHA